MVDRYSNFANDLIQRVILRSFLEDTTDNMVFGKQISARTKALVWYLNKYSDFSYRMTAKECGISKSSVQKICSSDFLTASSDATDPTSKNGKLET